MINGRINIGKYSIAPNTSDMILQKEEFNAVNMGETNVYISKSGQKLDDMMFWVTITCIDGIIKKVELSNSDDKYKMNYSNMKDETLLELKEIHDNFLEQHLGTPDKKSVGTKEYLYSWGTIISFLDNKTGDCGILIRYN